MSSSFRQKQIEDRRLLILQVLEKDPDYRINEHVIRGALDLYGHGISLDALHGELAWLDEQGLVTLATVGPVQVARLTARGEDAALGRAVIPGIARPRP